MLAQILSGIFVSVISFAFGYFLFRSQTREQIRLEVYRRRLDSYEKIGAFLDSLDVFAHRGFLKGKKDEFVQRALDLETSTAPYTPPELNGLLQGLWDDIDNLPGSLAELEETDTRIKTIIEKDIGLHLPNRIMESDNKERRLKRREAGGGSCGGTSLELKDSTEQEPTRPAGGAPST
jgi:hypothetical protein